MAQKWLSCVGIAYFTLKLDINGKSYGHICKTLSASEELYPHDPTGGTAPNSRREPLVWF